MHSDRSRRAFTAVELLAVIVTMFLLILVFLPDHPFFPHCSRSCGPRIRCVNNLKQVGLAFQLWSGDNNEMYPMQAFTNETGAPLFADGINGFRYFQVMSNELGTPKILVCPADTARRAATNFTTDFAGANVSYFIGFMPNETTHPFAFLSGDRNITNGQKPLNGMLEVTTNQNIGWTSELHNQMGNAGMADGSVQQLTTVGLMNLARHTGLATNRILLP